MIIGKSAATDVGGVRHGGLSVIVVLLMKRLFGIISVRSEDSSWDEWGWPGVRVVPHCPGHVQITGCSHPVREGPFCYCRVLRMHVQNATRGPGERVFFVVTVPVKFIRVPLVRRQAGSSWRTARSAPWLGDTVNASRTGAPLSQFSDLLNPGWCAGVSHDVFSVTILQSFLA